MHLKFWFIFCSLLFSTFLEAAVISFNYVAVEIEDGGIVKGSFGYDTDFENQILGPSDRGRYEGGFWTGTVVGGSQDGANFSFFNTAIFIMLNVKANTDPGDEIFVVDDASKLGTSTFFSLADNTATALTNTALPFYPVGTNILGIFPDTNSFGANLFLGDSDVGLSTNSQGVYRFVSVVVPEPSIYLLLIIAVFHFFGMGYRKKESCAQ